MSSPQAKKAMEEDVEDDDAGWSFSGGHKQNFEDDEIEERPSNKCPRISLEKCWKDGNGAARSYTVGLEEAEPTVRNFDWYLRCDTLQMWLPVPMGYEPVLEEDDKFN
ncbi:hypothetical protein VKT23_012270 [Stygiomarasmius scandens]|uniref:Uncharacterized protein n=1 Tax=Marasmiellus scandens TaxID=2682957 RepID=A0ABR1J931_9AGAR